MAVTVAVAVAVAVPRACEAEPRKLRGPKAARPFGAKAARAPQAIKEEHEQLNISLRASPTGEALGKSNDHGD